MNEEISFMVVRRSPDDNERILGIFGDLNLAKYFAKQVVYGFRMCETPELYSLKRVARLDITVSVITNLNKVLLTMKV